MNMAAPTDICLHVQFVRQLGGVALLGGLALNFFAGCSLQGSVVALRLAARWQSVAGLRPAVR